MLVSIVLSVFNAEKYLFECLQSIENQTYNHWELVIINDGSTDYSHQIICAFMKKWQQQVQYFHLKENKKLPYCLNLGIQQARGIYIARMDADDIMLPARLEKQVQYLEQNQAIDILGSAALEIDENGCEISIIQHPPDHLSIQKGLIHGCPILHPTVMMRKKMFLKKIFYRDLYPKAEDRDLWLRLSLTATFANLTEPLVKKRTHSEQVTMSKQTYTDSLKVSIDFFLKQGILLQNISSLVKPLGITLMPNFLYVFVRNFRKEKRKKITIKHNSHD
jgi:glycosyltransferase EpsE